MNAQRLGHISVRSAPYGKGVFSQRPMKKGSRVGLMMGKIIEHDDYDPDYVVDLDKAGVLLPFGPYKFLNHSCEPNCELVEEEGESGRPEIWVYAVADISPGDQLTIDYAWPAAETIPCMCGAAECRGFIVAKEEAHRVPQSLRRAASEMMGSVSA